MADGKKIHELFDASDWSAHRVTTEEILAEKKAIEDAFIAMGLTVEQGIDKVRRHDYHHGGDFDLLAERFIENSAWLRVALCQFFTEYGNSGGGENEDYKPDPGVECTSVATLVMPRTGIRVCQKHAEKIVERWPSLGTLETRFEPA